MSLWRFNDIQITTILLAETVLTNTHHLELEKEYILRHRCDQSIMAMLGLQATDIGRVINYC